MMDDFGESVCKLFFWAYGKKMEEVRLHLFTDNVIVNSALWKLWLWAMWCVDLLSQYITTMSVGSIWRSQRR